MVVSSLLLLAVSLLKLRLRAILRRKLTSPVDIWALLAQA